MTGVPKVDKVVATSCSVSFLPWGREVFLVLILFSHFSFASPSIVSVVSFSSTFVSSPSVLDASSSSISLSSSSSYDLVTSSSFIFSPSSSSFFPSLPPTLEARAYLCVRPCVSMKVSPSMYNFFLVITRVRKEKKNEVRVRSFT